MWCGTSARVRLPLNLRGEGIQVWSGAYRPANARSRQEAHGRVGYGETTVPFAIDDGALVLDVDRALREHWLYVGQRKSKGAYG